MTTTTQSPLLTQEQLEVRAETIMREFNFDKVHAHMVATGWTWHVAGRCHNAIPAIEDLRMTARTLLTQAIWHGDSAINVGTGGFMVYKLPWGLSLTFQLAWYHC